MKDYLDSLLPALSGASNLDTERQPKQEQIEYIDISKIDDDARNFYELSDLDNLAGNIELCGLQQPLRVRTSPTKPSRVVIVSGHRRKAALQMLVDEGKTQFQSVPCIREEAPESWAMQELRLIYANSATRKLSSADLAKEAERVEDLLYQLKEEGVEFPGRMRDHVAQACQTSKSKLARLKVIRENLAESLQADWSAGSFSDQAAYALARMPDWMQEAFATKSGKHSYGGEQCEKMLGAVENYVSPAPDCYSGHKCEECTNGQNFLQHDIREQFAYNLCKGSRCCFSCPYATSCKFVCSEKESALKKETSASAEQNAKDEAQRKERSDALLAEAKTFWSRVADFCGTADVDLLDAAKILLPYYQTTTVVNIAEDSFDGLIYSPHDVGLIPVRQIKELCALLGCSADALLGFDSASSHSRLQAVWEPSPSVHDQWDCSNCGNYEYANEDPVAEGYKFCSRCGAEMKTAKTTEGANG